MASYAPLTLSRLPSQFDQIDYVQQETNGGSGNEPPAASTSTAEPCIEVICGPLLNYKRLDNADSAEPTWGGSVLIVTKPGDIKPTLHLNKSSSGVLANSRTNQTVDTNGLGQKLVFEGVKLYQDPGKAFWAFPIELPLGAREMRWQYVIPNVSYVAHAGRRPKPKQSFVVPAATDSMRMMFHSCNGFSIGTDVESYNGAVLWNDVLRMHRQKPFHVMIGGGDQIYNDNVRTEGPLQEWTSIKNPVKRREYPFNESLRKSCDEFYFQNYVKWYSAEPFASANSEIPQINIWDDHDIIDGFGSYTEHFMKCHVFRGIGGVAFKYYCLFQHHVPPPRSTFTTDAPQTGRFQDISGPGEDPAQTKDTFVLSSEKQDPSFIIGNTPGPYVEEVSRSLYCRLGANIAFVGIDARTERTRHQVNYDETYDLIFGRLMQELSVSPGKIKHLVVLLGVPIAYPRLIWLENIFTSPIMGPVRLLNKRFGFAGGLFNNFDGNVDLLDDLDDHYTARAHKPERKELMHRLQKLSLEHSVRITILGGDVHLAAVGRFYSKLKLDIAPEHDHRYMANVISSAITNKPPPSAVANLLSRRNRIHHLDHETDETLMPLFNRDPGISRRTGSYNHVTMPSRNYAILSETPTPQSNGATSNIANNGISHDDVDGAAESRALSAGSSARPKTKPRDGHEPIQAGEDGAGTVHPAATGLESGELVGGLDVCIRVERDQRDMEGLTDGYGFSIPMLSVRAKDVLAAEEARHFRLHVHHHAADGEEDASMMEGNRPQTGSRPQTK